MSLRAVAVIAFLASTSGCEPFGPSGPIRDAIPNPAAEFSEITRLELPEGAKLVVADDTHGGFHGDGELFFVYTVSREAIEEWLVEPPPWSQREWQRGPVPREISSHCLDAPTEGMNRNRVRYVAEDSEYSGIPWHNGRLLVLDPQAGRVVLSCWDF